MINNLTNVDMYIIYCIIFTIIWSGMGILAWRRQTAGKKYSSGTLFSSCFSYVIILFIFIVAYTIENNSRDFGIWGCEVGVLLSGLATLVLIYRDEVLLLYQGEQMEMLGKISIEISQDRGKLAMVLLPVAIISIGWIGWDRAVEQVKDKVYWEKRHEERQIIEQLKRLEKMDNVEKVYIKEGK